ncbi:hypothetical protein MUP29_02455, partial [bacterium]|nr:hypothetical protein [bacterium]
MIPSLVLIRSDKKLLIALTRKRDIQIGIQKDSDVVINHPHLHKHPQLLGPGSAPGNTTPKETTKSKGKTSFFIPVYTFSIDGLNIRM